MYISIIFLIANITAVLIPFIALFYFFIIMNTKKNHTSYPEILYFIEALFFAILISLFLTLYSVSRESVLSRVFAGLSGISYFLMLVLILFRWLGVYAFIWEVKSCFIQFIKKNKSEEDKK